MPRNTRASKRKNDDSDTAQTPTPSKKKAPATTPQSAKTRKNAKNSPKTETPTATPKRSKRKLEDESAGEESSPSTSPKTKKRDVRSSKPNLKSPISNEKFQEEVPVTKKQQKSTPPRTSTRKSKRQSSLTISPVSETKPSDEEVLSTPKKSKITNSPHPKSNNSTTPKKEIVSQKEQEKPIPKKIKKPFKIIEKAPLPRQLSREEIYSNYLKGLEEKLDKFDLSKKTCDSNEIFSKWPDSEVLNNLKKNPLLNRIWYSNESTGATPTKNRVGEFNVASYDIKEIKTGNKEYIQIFSLVKEEISYIDADVFCIQNVSSECEKNLLSCLGDKKYTFRGPNHGCVIGFKEKKFTIIDMKVVDPNQTLIDFIDKTSYPEEWKSCIKASINYPSTLNSCPLIIYVLKHIETGVQVLLASQSNINGKVASDPSQYRPDLNALNVTSIMWSICKAWNEIGDIKANQVTNNSNKKNGANGSHSKPAKRSWLFCGSLNASHESPIYQIIRDGYPCDDTINRLRCIRSVQLEKEKKVNEEKSMKKALIDLLWHAFQHPQTDVTSCYADVIGREPPFTQVNIESGKASDPTKCDHYIWCSKSSLRPKSVLLTPCRAIMSGANEPNLSSFSIPLAAKIEIISN